MYVPETDDMYWDDLTSEQQQAAGQLCFSKELWDEVPLPDWKEKLLANTETVKQEAGSIQPTLLPSSSSPAPLPYCPPHYSKDITYAAGDYVSIKNKQLDQTGIFQCNNEPGFEIYCNIHDWDDALLDENENAKDMWNNAWVPISECHDTQTPTSAPSRQHTDKPVTDSPSQQPTSSPVTNNPSNSPSKQVWIQSPTTSPTLKPTEQPSPPPKVVTPALPVNPVASQIPEKRYVAWSLLNDDDKTIATVNLEYDQSVSFLSIKYQFCKFATSHITLSLTYHFYFNSHGIIRAALQLRTGHITIYMKKNRMESFNSEWMVRTGTVLSITTKVTGGMTWCIMVMMNIIQC